MPRPVAHPVVLLSRGAPEIPDQIQAGGRFVSIPRRQVEATINPETGLPEFTITVNGKTVRVPPEGWLA